MYIYIYKNTLKYNALDLYLSSHMYIYIYAYSYTDMFTVPEKELYLKLKKLYTNPKQTLNQPLLATSSAGNL